MKPLRNKTLSFCTTFFLLISGCATTTPPPVPKFNAQWEFIKKDETVFGCLKKEDVKMLREILIRLNANKNPD